MKQWVNACIREFLIPLLNYVLIGFTQLNEK